jgi:mRNA interferase MazF
LADAGRGDWILTQVTSKPYGDPQAIELNQGSFRSGSLRIVSYARPGKLFTANDSLIVAEIGVLTEGALSEITTTVVTIIKGRRLPQHKM